MLTVLESSVENIEYAINWSTENKEPVIFPTDTIYGLGALVPNLEASQKIYKYKNRNSFRCLAILVSTSEQAQSFVDQEIPKNFYNAKEAYGAYTTFILNAKKELTPPYISENNTVALRYVSPEHFELGQAIKNLGPVAATSANLSGVDYVHDFDVVKDVFSQHGVQVFVKYKEHVTGSIASRLVNACDPNNLLFIR